MNTHAIRTPDANAFVDSDGQVYSYAQFQAAIDEAVQFLGEYELKAGDRIVLVSENCLATPVFIFAASRVGAYIIPINARMSPVELRRIVEHSTPRITLYTSDVSKEASLHATTAKAKMRESGFGNFAVATFAQEQPATPRVSC